MSGQPEADVELQAQMLRMLKRFDELEIKVEQQKQENEELKASQAELKRKVEKRAKAEFNELGGEDIFYMDVDALLPEMLDGAENKEDIEKWAKDARKTGNKRITISIVSGALLGAAGGAGALIVPKFAVCGACASLAAGPAVLVVLGGLVGTAALVGVAIGIYKLYRMYKISTEKKQRELEKKAALLAVSNGSLNADAE